MWELLQHGFVLRGLLAGICVGIIAPLLGMFLVLRRYALVADTLSHVSLAGVAIAILIGVNPLLGAIVASVGSVILIDRLRASNNVSGETALALFLSGSLALAIALISYAHGLNANLFSYLFGSIVTVSTTDVAIIAIVGTAIVLLIGLLYYELLYITFDEEAAKVAGLPVNIINMLFMMATATAVALAMPIVGILLISALIVIPVATALQLKKSFLITLLSAELSSLISVIGGLLASLYFDISSGAAIVLLALILFTFVLIWRRA